MKVEYLAVYRTTSDVLIAFPLIKDAERAYRLSTPEGLMPIRHFLNDGALEFCDFQLAEGPKRGQRHYFMRMLLTAPPKPAKRIATAIAVSSALE